MKKHDTIFVIAWLLIISAVIYNIGIASTLIILLIILVGSLIYIGVP